MASDRPNRHHVWAFNKLLHLHKAMVFTYYSMPELHGGLTKGLTYAIILTKSFYVKGDTRT